MTHLPPSVWETGNTVLFPFVSIDIIYVIAGPGDALRQIVFGGEEDPGRDHGVYSEGVRIIRAEESAR